MHHALLEVQVQLAQLVLAVAQQVLGFDQLVAVAQPA